MQLLPGLRMASRVSRYVRICEVIYKFASATAKHFFFYVYVQMPCRQAVMRLARYVTICSVMARFLCALGHVCASGVDIHHTCELLKTCMHYLIQNLVFRANRFLKSGSLVWWEARCL